MRSNNLHDKFLQLIVFYFLIYVILISIERLRRNKKKLGKPQLSSKGCRRGQGHCKKCGAQFSNRSKPQYCQCGFELGGSYIGGGSCKTPAAPQKVNVYENDTGVLYSIRVTAVDYQNFLLENNYDKICYVKDCLELRKVTVMQGN